MSGTTVCLLRSTDTGAPVLSGTAGALIALLDACLVDGYNSQSIQSITTVGDVATVTYASAHNYAADGLTKILISGCDQPEYNGIQQITNVSTNSFDFTVTGTPASGTGTMTSKAAPLGWTKAFSGTNKGAYQSSEVTSTQLYLRVDDTGTTVANACGYETMTDVDTGTGLFPTTIQMASGVFFNKSNLASTSARDWVLVGDGFEFHLFESHHASYVNVFKQFHFGDPASEMASDPYGCLIYGDYLAGSTGTPEANQNTYQVSTSGAAQQGHYMARAYAQTGQSIAVNKQGNNSMGSTTIGGAAALIPYPSPHNNGIYAAPLFIYDGFVLRAQLKGIYQPLHYHPLGHGSLLPAASSPINRRIYAIGTAYASGTAGETHVDIDGPWR